MEKLLLNILRALVVAPEDLQVQEVRGGRTRFIEILCHPDDTKTVIGKNGKTISAIRTLVNAIAGNDEVNYVVEVIEPS